MTTLQAVLFGSLAIMVFVWFGRVARLSRLLRERHAAKYEEMGLEDMWPKDLGGWFAGHNNTRPVFALFRFLFRGGDAGLMDAEVSSQAAFLRWFFLAYLVLFLALAFSILNGMRNGPAGRQWHAAAVPDTIEYRRERVYAPYREKKWAQAIAGYDALRPESGHDPELTYWRGMAHWQLNDTENALQDFRRAIELDPAHFDAHRNADRILSNQRRWDEILAMWDRYIERTPGSAEAYFERGGTNFHKGNLAAAQADAAKACELGKAEACTQATRLKGRL